MTASLRIQSSKADSNTCESFTRSGLKLESVHQESPRSDVFRKRATKPLLNQRQRQKRLTWAVEKKNWTVAQWSKVLFSDESKFCISFGNKVTIYKKLWSALTRTVFFSCLIKCSSTMGKRHKRFGYQAFLSVWCLVWYTEEGLVAETFVSFPHWWWRFNKTEKEDCSRECRS